MGAEFTFRCRRMLRRFPIFHRFATFALRLGPFGSVFGNGAPVCSENGAFRTRNWDLNFGDGAPVWARLAPCLDRVGDPSGNHRFAADRMALARIGVPYVRITELLPGSGSEIRGGLFLTSARTLKRYPLLGNFPEDIILFISKITKRFTRDLKETKIEW